jgi:uncharacterized protein (DUF2336 family)
MLGVLGIGMSAQSGFALLKDFAEESSSDKRRELLRQATDVFLAEGRALTDEENHMLDEVVSAVSADLSSQVRVELARKIAASSIPFSRTARTLALDHIDVARPILEGSRGLSEADLLHIIETRSADHMMAVTQRTDIGERVAHALVSKGEDSVVVSLLENKHAKIGAETFAKVAERAETSSILHAPFVRRQGVPLHLLHDLFLKVETDLRGEILRQYEGVSQAELEVAFERSRKRLSKAYGALPEDYDAARRLVDDAARKGQLAPPALVTLLRGGRAKRTAFVLAFAKLTEVNYELIDRLVESSDLDAIAMLCRAADFDRALFVTIAMLIAGKDAPLSRVTEFGELYKAVPLVAAQRAIRFWKVRAKA